MVDETISNIQNIIDLSPEDHVDSLTVKAKKGPVNQSPKITISCCNTDEENDKASAQVVITVPYDVDDTDAPKLKIPIIMDQNNVRPIVDTTAIKQSLLEGLEASTLVEDLASLTSTGASELDFVNTEANAKSTPNIHFNVPIPITDKKEETKQTITSSVVDGVKYAVSKRKGDSKSKQTLSISSVKGPKIDVTIVQTSCCAIDKDTKAEIVNVNIQLKSESDDNLYVDIPIDEFIDNSDQQQPNLQGELLTEKLDKVIEDVVENIDIGSLNQPDPSSDTIFEQSGNKQVCHE